MPGLDVLYRLVTREHPARPVILFRVVLGLCHVWKAAVYWQVTAAMLRPGSFRANWSGWELIGETTRPWIFAVWALSAIGLIFGFRVRLAAALCAAAVVALAFTDIQLLSNHLYLLFWVTIFVAILNPSNSKQHVAYWPVFLTCFLVATLYFFTAISKCNPEFLSGAVIRDLGHLPFTDKPFPGASFAAWFTIIAEFLLPFALWRRGLQPWAFLIGFLLHVGIVLSMQPVRNLVVFSAVMLGSYLYFLDARPKSRLVIWDDQCGFCAGWVKLFRRLDWLDVLRFEGSSNSALLAKHGIAAAEADAGLQLVDREDRKSGYDAVVGVMDGLPITFLWAAALRIPPVPLIGRRIYDRVARNRRCILPPPPVAKAS